MSSAIRILGIIMLTLSVFACDRSSRMVQRGEVVNLYSNCLSATDQDLFLPFETASGLKVNIISKPNYQVLDRILSLGEDSTNADVLLLRGRCLSESGQTVRHAGYPAQQQFAPCHSGSPAG